MDLFRKFRARSRQREFDTLIARYLGEVLGPALGIRSPGTLLRSHGRRRTHAAESARGGVIVKFYLKRSGEARAAAEAQPLMEARGIPVARLLHADVSKESAERWGLACIVYERLEGRGMDPETDAALVPEVARLLARMHGDVSAEAGGWSAMGARLGVMLARIAALPVDGAARAADGLRDFLAPPMESSESERPGAAIGGWSLLHNDLGAHNVLVRPGGGLAVIDLDACGRGLAGIELAHALPRFTMTMRHRKESRFPVGLLRGGPTPADGFIAAYLDAAPAAFRADWDRWGAWHILWDLADATATTAGDLASRSRGKDERERADRLARLQVGLIGDSLATARERGGG